MKFTRTKIEDVIICEPDIHGDNRGYFMESFNKKELEEFIDSKIKFCQDNEAKSNYGVLRGLHYQLPPFSQTKLVRVIQGNVLDIAVDIRKSSKTFGQYVAIELSGENKKQLFVPKGFAHGYLVLSERAIFSYKVDNYYSPKHDRGISFDDKSIAIDWTIDRTEMILSTKDMNQIDLKKAEVFE